MSKYELIIGLEVHAQLLTNSKLFSAASNSSQSSPNSAIDPVVLGYPGSLPKMNRQAIELAVRLGLACGCEIERENFFARKHYFYPDLPKGYQISQHTTPICKGGYLKIKLKDYEKNIQLNRIHLEEDAGKLIHDAEDSNSLIDYNRAGVPLVEIVTEPDLRSGDEAFAFLTELRRLVRYLEVCDGNMEDGSLRCDANLSIRKVGDKTLGTKVEIKNLNSIRNVKRAIEAEYDEMVKKVKNGISIARQTKSFDAQAGKSFPTRDKEEADDYRYFPDPDLPPFIIDEEFTRTIVNTMPRLRHERIGVYQQEGLSEYEAEVLTDDREFSDLFEELLAKKKGVPAKSISNWMLGPIKSYMNQEQVGAKEIPLSSDKIVELISKVDEGQLSFSAASTRIFPWLCRNGDFSVDDAINRLDLLQDKDSGSIEPIVEGVLSEFPQKVREYHKGKKGLLGLFVGEVMKRSGGKADPSLVNQIILEKLKNRK